MGDTTGRGQKDEHPLREVEISGFWMMRTEVTRGMCAHFVSRSTLRNRGNASHRKDEFGFRLVVSPTKAGNTETQFNRTLTGCCAASAPQDAD